MRPKSDQLLSNSRHFTQKGKRGNHLGYATPSFSSNEWAHSQQLLRSHRPPPQALLNLSVLKNDFEEVVIYPRIEENQKVTFTKIVPQKFNYDLSPSRTPPFPLQDSQFAVISGTIESEKLVLAKQPLTSALQTCNSHHLDSAKGGNAPLERSYHPQRIPVSLFDAKKGSTLSPPC